jgi:tetratricopeptide (TPR) repeat protein
MHFRARTHRSEHSRRVSCGGWLAGIAFLFGIAVAGHAADTTRTIPPVPPKPPRDAQLERAEKLFLDGHYADCTQVAKQTILQGVRTEDWPLLLGKCLLTLGQYAEAGNVVSNALNRYSGSLRLRLLAREVYQQNGQVELAKQVVAEIESLARNRPWAYRDSAGLVAIGQAMLLRGTDPRVVLDNILNRVKQADPTYRETYLAIGQLALDKDDSQLAAKTFQEGLDRFDSDPELLYGLAKSFSSGDRSQMVTYLEQVLQRNEHHVPSLLLLADHMIDAEEYPKADELLTKTLTVNPQQPEAWAYRAVLAHLRNQFPEEQKARETALAHWPTNPNVDYLIGLKISQKYRFAEGSSYQRRALKSDEDYLPAKTQLAQDLLRLGEEEEGWALAEDVHKQDGYNVAAYNVVTLHDTLAKFAVLTNDEFKVRMSAAEAAIYGGRVTNLLERAKRFLCNKYGRELTRQTVVEIFPEQKDFAVRTFGMPGGEGFLGVCFGSVITANSPASHAASYINWQSVLWHEFCHVVTLSMTHNKMPRWLSEGISVYEERQANPAWGEQLNPRYRDMIKKGELTPVGNLSAAFLAPKTPLHLQFAYYESSLVVEFLVDNFGLGALKKILNGLSEGKSINQAIEENTAPLAKIEKDFATFALQRAEDYAPGLDWTQPGPDEVANGLESWMGKHPKSLLTLTHQGKKLIEAKKWAEAKAPLEKLLELYPQSTGPDSAYLLLAEAHRGLNETEQERAILSKLARIDADASPAYLRLMDLDLEAKDWKAANRDAQRFLAVNPLVPQPYRCLARANEELGQDHDAMQAYDTLLLLDPPDPADVHYRLAHLLHKTGDPRAKRQVLQALEDAPRFRDAHRLLLEIEQTDPVKAEEAAPVESAPPGPRAEN